MPSLRPPRRFLLLSVAAAVACTGDPVTLCGCDPIVPAGVLYGRVTSAAGVPVNQAEVVAQLGIPDCAAAVATVSAGRTDTDGRYRMVVPGPGDDRGRCLRAYATPPAGGAQRTSDTIPFTLQFTGSMSDSARVDLVLRAP